MPNSTAARRRRVAQTYKGTLNQPIELRLRVPATPLAGTPEYVDQWRAYEKELRAARTKKVPELFKHYGIDEHGPSPWMLLALSLAFDHVRGFQIKKVGGAPRTVATDQDLYLRVHLWQLRHPGDSVLAACRALKVDGVEPFLSLIEITAERRFKTAKKIWHRLFDGIPADVLEKWCPNDGADQRGVG